MKNPIKFLLAVFTFTFIFSKGDCQETGAKPGTINFFLDCFHCDFTFVRQELPFISFVRDPQLADVHILMSESETGGGGNKYFLNFIGLKSFKDMDFEYTTTTTESDTDDDIRKALLKLIKIGVLPYYSKTSFIDQLNIDLEESENRSADNLTIDRWKKWVFSIQSGGELQKEESQSSYSLNFGTSAEKITDAWKIGLEGFYNFDREKFIDEDTTIINKQDSKEFEGSFIKSLNEKWSAGVFTDYSSRNYINTEHRGGIAAGIEYNIFPWKECNRRVFAIRYLAGVNYVDYYKRTLYDKMYETLFAESLEINLELIQPWGEISLGLEGRHYFHDFSKNRLTLESDFSIRITKNLSFYCELMAEVIHDQLYLAIDEASRDDILLERRKLATTYEIGGHLGIRFTFGSMYNNVVNERF